MRYKIILFLLFLIIFIKSVAFDSTAYNGSQHTGKDSIPNPVEVLCKYLQFASYSGKEYEAGHYLIDVCQTNGLNVTVFTDTGGSINFAASLYPLSLKKPNIVFLHHIDVVPEGNLSKWKYPPFSGAIAEGSIWGRGALDIKELGIMHLFALLKFKELAKNKDLPYNFTLLAVSGEETGGYIGSKIIVSHFIEQLNPVLVLGEGGSGIDFLLSASKEKPLFGISIAEKTSLCLKLHLDMETLAHGAVTPNEYPNQIMIEALSRIDKRIPKIKFNKASRRMFNEVGKIEGGFEGFVLQNMNWVIFKPFVIKSFVKDPNLHSISSNTITITSIKSAQGADNQIAQSIEATLDCRLLSSTEDKILIKEIQELLNDSRIKIEIIDKGADSYLSVPEYFYEVMEKAIKTSYKKSKVAPMFLPSSSDNNYFRSKGIPVYGIIPIVLNKQQLNSIHNYNEHIQISNFLKGIDVFELFIEALIANPLENKKVK